MPNVPALLHGHGRTVRALLAVSVAGQWGDAPDVYDLDLGLITLARWDPTSGAVSLLRNVPTVSRSRLERDDSLIPSLQADMQSWTLVAAGVRADNEITWSPRMTRVVASEHVFLK